MDKAGRSALRRIGSFIFIFTIISLMFSVAIVIFLTRSGVSIVSIKGDSMSPTFESNDTIVMVQADEIGAEQVVILRKPDTWVEYKTKEKLIKRIVGIPNDTFSFNGKEIKINDKTIIDIEKSNYHCEAEPQEFTLKEGEFLVIGDNYTNSLDSFHVFCNGKEHDMIIDIEYIDNYGEVRFIF